MEEKQLTDYEAIRAIANNARSTQEQANITIRTFANAISRIADYAERLEHAPDEGESRIESVTSGLAMSLRELLVLSERLRIRNEVLKKSQKSIQKSAEKIMKHSKGGGTK